ncbi:hypothetical protein P691DRAFT_773297 [Macrolepiota fuliginosa MF-IS2]|uniref:Uncharacterized protein n=1 Tax=Macrolepiota fuliginosa MF-IS2 TaxID=1400762 RepID=A0A9P5XI76_9AGAR|nr:hypothetical protein P691DRAFT_773297 [Macrolepiota fuliginosa MF-IS2]
MHQNEPRPLTYYPDFLPIEALLELFANLLPSATTASGREKRTQFIKEVFNPTSFPNYQEILSVLDAVIIKDWSITTQRISDLMASEIPSHPQPFETKGIRDSLVDVHQRKMSLAGNGVKLSDTHPPISSQSEGNFFLLWSIINPTDATSPLLPVSRTSKAQAMSTVPSRSDIINSGHETSHSRSGRASSTVVAAPEDHVDTRESQKNTGSVVVPQAPIDDDGVLPELTDSESELEASPSQVVRKVVRRNKDILVIRSDTEFESVPESVSKELRKHQSKHETNDTAKAIIFQTPPARNERKNEVAVASAKSTRQTRSATRALTVNSDASRPPTDYVTRKHGRSESGADDDEDGTDKPEVPYPKRPRIKLEPEDDKPIEQPETAKLKITKKYRAKVKTSSTSSNNTQGNVDFDKPPNTIKAVVTRMKKKGGQTATAKPRPVKPRPVKKEEKNVALREIVQFNSDGEGQGERRHAEPKTEKNSKEPRVEEAEEPAQTKLQKAKKAPWDDPAFVARIEMSTSEVDTSSMQISELLDHPVPEVDLQVWQSSASSLVSSYVFNLSIPQPLHVADLKAPTIEVLQEDTEMIDLTKDDDPLKPEEEVKVLSVARRSAVQTPHRLPMEPVGVTQSPSAAQRQLAIGGTKHQARSFGRAKIVKASVDVGIQADVQEVQLVTPKARTVKKIVPLPVKMVPVRMVQRVQTPVIQGVQESVATYITSTPLPKGGLSRSPIRISRPPTIRRIRNPPAASSPTAFRSTKKYAPVAENCKIVDVLNEIGDVVLHKIYSGLEGVRNDLKIAERKMLVATREKLDQMRSTNADHYNNLVELFEKYAKERRECLELFEELRRVNQETQDGVAGILIQHSRQSLSKKFPKTMFANVPPIIRNPKLFAT